MPSRYFFNLVNGSDTIPDLEGVEAEDARTAVSLAHEGIEELLREEPFANVHWKGWHLEIVHESGQSIHRIKLWHYHRTKNRKL